jgi:hypothetical protein
VRIASLSNVPVTSGTLTVVSPDPTQFNGDVPTRVCGDEADEPFDSFAESLSLHAATTAAAAIMAHNPMRQSMVRIMTFDIT